MLLIGIFLVVVKKPAALFAHGVGVTAGSNASEDRCRHSLGVHVHQEGVRPPGESACHNPDPRRCDRCAASRGTEPLSQHGKRREVDLRVAMRVAVVLLDGEVPLVVEQPVGHAGGVTLAGLSNFSLDRAQ